MDKKAGTVLIIDESKLTSEEFRDLFGKAVLGMWAIEDNNYDEIAKFLDDLQERNIADE